MSRSRWEYVHKEIHKGDPVETIVFIRDLDQGGRSVTNDAENVLRECQNAHGACRVVYQDSQGDWAEICWSDVMGIAYGVTFKPWHGLVWDRLTKV